MFYSCDDKGVHNATTDTRKLVVNRVFCFGFLMCNDVDGSDVQTRRGERVATGLMQIREHVYRKLTEWVDVHYETYTNAHGMGLIA